MSSVQTKLTELEDQRQVQMRTHERAMSILDAQIEVLREVLTVSPSTNGVHHAEATTPPALPPTRGRSQSAPTTARGNRAERIRQMARMAFPETFTTADLIKEAGRQRMTGVNATNIYTAVQQMIRQEQLRIVGTETSPSGRTINIYEWV